LGLLPLAPDIQWKPPAFTPVVVPFDSDEDLIPTNFARGLPSLKFVFAGPPTTTSTSLTLKSASGAGCIGFSFSEGGLLIMSDVVHSRPELLFATIVRETIPLDITNDVEPSERDVLIKLACVGHPDVNQSLASPRPPHAGGIETRGLALDFIQSTATRAIHNIYVSGVLWLVGSTAFCILPVCQLFCSTNPLVGWSGVPSPPSFIFFDVRVA
jgi:hypothetical protein